MTDPDPLLRQGPGFVSSALPAFLPSDVVLPKIREGGGGGEQNWAPR